MCQLGYWISLPSTPGTRGFPRAGRPQWARRRRFLPSRLMELEGFTERDPRRPGKTPGLSEEQGCVPHHSTVAQKDLKVARRQASMGGSVHFILREQCSIHFGFKAIKMIHSSIKCFLSTYCLPGPVAGTGVNGSEQKCQREEGCRVWLQ